mgnify:CR=1 FL=1
MLPPPSFCFRAGASLCGLGGQRAALFEGLLQTAGHVERRFGVLVAGAGQQRTEAVDGGPIAFVKDGDLIRIDTIARTLDLLVDEAELNERRKNFKPIPHKYTRGVLAKYSKVVQSASKGAVCG